MRRRLSIAVAWALCAVAATAGCHAFLDFEQEARPSDAGAAEAPGLADVARPDTPKLQSLGCAASPIKYDFSDGVPSALERLDNRDGTIVTETTNVFSPPLALRARGAEPEAYSYVSRLMSQVLPSVTAIRISSWVMVLVDEGIGEDGAGVLQISTWEQDEPLADFTLYLDTPNSVRSCARGDRTGNRDDCASKKLDTFFKNRWTHLALELVRVDGGFDAAAYVDGQRRVIANGGAIPSADLTSTRLFAGAGLVYLARNTKGSRAFEYVLDDFTLEMCER